MQLTGPQTAALQTALLSAFPSYDSLKQMLFIQLDKRLEAIVGTGALSNVVFDLIMLAQAEGWLAELVKAARTGNAGNQQLRDFEQSLSGGIVAEAPDENKGNTAKPSTLKKKILFIAACAKNAQHIDYSTEYRKLQAEMRGGQARDAYEWLPPILAATVTEIMRGLHQKPDLIHFAGHGIEDKGILIENEQGTAQIISDEVLEMLFSPYKNRIAAIFLNACYSARQAQLLSTFGSCVVGHNIPVGDKAAIAFAKGFYLTLGEGGSVEEAVNSGKILVKVEQPNAAFAVEVWKDGEKLTAI